MWLGRWLLAALLLSASASHAGLRLSLDSQSLSSAQQLASQHLLDEALAALPPAFIQRLDREIPVHWQNNLPDAVYGRATAKRLELNRRLLPALTDGSAAQQPTGRWHGTLRRELLATLLHELTHLYDREQLWSPEQRWQYSQCHQLATRLGAVGLPEACRGKTQRQFSLSDDPRLLDLAGWSQRVGQRGQRDSDNGQHVRSPDAYELLNPKEFVAVNLEYFLLDPEYACRRPSLQRYFSAHFGWQPAAQKPCANPYPMLNAGRDFARTPLLQLNPAQVYEVDYLFAEANQEWVSRWGHSMLRLVICAPERPLGPACRLDLAHHLVLSFRAFVDDVQLSSWDGLVGEYPSRLFVLPLDQVIEEYTRMELRSLVSVPLRLSRPQIQALVARSSELHWSYDGTYYFLSNNCAVETLKLLRSGTEHPALESLDSITPVGLLELLEARGIADRQPLADPREALRLGYRFDSYRERYQAMFEVLKARLAIPDTELDDWLQHSALVRRPWIEQADLPASAALLLLEQGAYYQQLLQARDAVKRRYLSERGQTGHSLDKADAALRALLANSGYLSRPAELLGSKGYGIPQPSEGQILERETARRQQRLNQLGEQLDQEIRQLLDAARLTELQAAEQNLALIGQHLRALHKARGGWHLKGPALPAP